MLTVAIDLSAIEALEDEAVRSLEEDQPAQMKKILDDAAAEEISTHAYNNITGRLEASTFAGPLQSSTNEATVEYGARMEYASNVVDRGRSHVVDLAEKAESDIETYFEAEASRLASK